MKTLRIILNILVVSFFLNFAWEFLQSPFYSSFFRSLESNYSHYLLAILGDSFYTILIYFLISIINKDLFWIRNSWNKKNILISVLIGFLLAVFIEYKGVFILMKWNYSDLMPIIYGIGVIPIIQMMLLPILTFKIIKKIL